MTCVDAEKIDAHFDKGVLKISLPKASEAEADVRKITVNPASFQLRESRRRARDAQITRPFIVGFYSAQQFWPVAGSHPSGCWAGSSGAAFSFFLGGWPCPCSDWGDSSVVCDFFFFTG